MSFQEGCPICKVISSGKVLKNGTHCCSIKIGSLQVAVLKEHSAVAPGDAVAEAVDLLGGGKGFLVDYSEIPSHWGLRFVATRELPEGKAKGGSK